jgi:pimeloyl-ACP methyl ester carboxylesterase
VSLRLFDQRLSSGVTLSCRAAGAADAARRIVFLHGFPEGAFVWDGLMQALAPRAHCVAPNQRGYERSTAPAQVQDYRAKHLVGDIAALIEQLGAPIDLLVAHDWGGGVAWNLAALRPELLRRLVIINAPHPGAMLRELRDNPAQREASAYMNQLVLPGAAARLADDDFAALWRVFARSGEPAWLTPAVREAYRRVWRHGLDGALNWYRASPLRPPADGADALATLTLPPSVLHVNVPTTVLWGMADRALLPGLLDGLDQWVPRLQVHLRSDASHWIVHEQPRWLVSRLDEVLDHLG